MRSTSGHEDSHGLIRVMVACKREGVMDRLRAGLSDAADFLVLGPPEIPATALLGSVKIYRPDVLLLDQDVLRIMGERAIEQLVELPSHPRVLLLCDKPQPRVAGTVLKCRFYGYIGSGEQIGVLANAVRCVFRGELWVPRAALAETLYGPSRPRTTSKERPAL